MLTTLTVSFFSNGIYCILVCSHCYLFHWIPLRTVWLLFRSHQVSIQNNKSHPNILLLRLNGPQALSASPCMSDALIPSKPQWPFTGLAPLSMSSFVLGTPKLDTTLQVSDQCWNKEKELPPSSYWWCICWNAAQVLLCFFAKGFTCNLLFTMTCKSFPAKLPSSPQLVPVHEAIPSQWWGSAFPLVQVPESPLFSFLSPIKVPLHDSTTIWCINHSHVSIICTDRPKFTCAWHKLVVSCQPYQGLSASLGICQLVIRTSC